MHFVYNWVFDFLETNLHQPSTALSGFYQNLKNLLQQTKNAINSAVCTCNHLLNKTLSKLTNHLIDVYTEIDVIYPDLFILLAKAAVHLWGNFSLSKGDFHISCSCRHKYLTFLPGRCLENFH